MSKKPVKGRKRLVLLCATVLFMVLSPQVRAQSGLQEAHAILADLDKVQKSGRRDSDTINKLNALVARAQTETRGLITKGILGYLNSPGRHSADEMRQEISRALQIAPDYRPEVFVFSMKPPELGSHLVSYNVSYCASCSKAWIGVIGKKGGRYEVLSDLDDAFANKSLHVTSIPRGEGGKERFLIYGANWGDAHNRLTAVVYVLDGEKLREIWSRDDLPQGDLKISHSEITLTFLTALRPPWSERTEVYDVLADKIQLRSSSERSNP